jgi:hypothetical protein
MMDGRKWGCAWHGIVGVQAGQRRERERERERAREGTWVTQEAGARVRGKRGEAGCAVRSSSGNNNNSRAGRRR